MNNIYETFIAKSRYARYLDGASRRENWGETVNRYFDFMEKHLDQKSNFKLTAELRAELQSAVTNFEVMPSMRALMTAGKALERDNTAGYNCSYLPIDDPKAFDEAMFILLCGTGVGFSVERQYVTKLPEVPEKIYDSESTIVVSDSKEGWAKALRQVISLLYSGEAPRWNVDKVRPAGTRLKIFGGRASGPEPLVDLFKFVIKTFKNAQGRKLNSLECHDIMCKIGEVVVVGGVRRSAMISLSNLSDDRMRQAKSGAWWETNGQRALANNSACYTEKPDVGIFMREWVSLYESKSGERGIFNREAAKNVAKMNGRRDINHEFGTNPCCFVGDTLVAVADGRNAVTIEQLANESHGINAFKVYSASPVMHANQHGTSETFSHWKTEIKSAIARCTGEKPVFKVTLSNGDSFEATDDHPLATAAGRYVQVKDSIGIKLESFFTHQEKYRKINAISDGYSYQHRLIWENANGLLPAGSEIDHIVPGNGDQLSNLQILKRDAHLIKTSGERRGANNPIHRADKHRLSTNISAAVGHYGNPRWLGLSDENLISIGRDAVKNGIGLSFTNLRQLDDNFPLSFSKNRFHGSIAEFRDIVLGNKQYIPPLLTDAIAAAPADTSHLTNDVWVISIEQMGVKRIFDLQVEDNHNFNIITNSFDEHGHTTRGLLVHNSEIILRPYQFCNLTEVIVRANDTMDELKRKMRIATILGTFQSSLTHFPYLRKIWRDNTEQERLLGVSMTGILDNKLLNNPDDAKLPDRLSTLKAVTVAVNEEFAALVGVQNSVAITAVKPSGCTALETSIKTSSGNITMLDIFLRNGYSKEDLAVFPPKTWLDVKAEMPSVLDENNVEQSITKLFVNGEQEVFELVFGDGNVYKFTGNHKLKTVDGWKRVDELTDQDEIVSF